MTKQLRFNENERQGLYRAIFERRDVRSQFLPDPIADEVLARLINAAHHAPSVGFMQPWDFIVIRSTQQRSQVKAMFERENARAAEQFAEDRKQLYSRLKLEGIMESPLNLCITCDRSRAGPNVLGRNTILETDLFSTCMAVQNLWLAARAEGIGAGWVSVLDPDELAGILALPANVYPLAYLCLGYVSEFLPQPELQHHGWRNRLNPTGLLHQDAWGTPANSDLARHLEAEFAGHTGD